MIEVISGKLGGGKTLFSARRMLEHMARGGTVVSNVHLHKFNCEKYLLDKWGVICDFDAQFQTLPEECVESWHEHIPLGESPDLPVLCVIDEAHLWINARDTRSSNKEAMKHLSQSRKLCIDFLFIVQAPENLDVQVNRLAQHQIRCRDMRKFRIAKLGIPWPFPQLMVSRWDYNMKDLLDYEMWWIDKRVFGCYKTDALLRPIKGLPTVKRGRFAVKKKPTKMKFVLIVLVICVGFYYLVQMCFSVYGKTKSLNALAHATPAPVATTAQADPRHLAPSVAPVVVLDPRRQETFRGYSDGCLVTDVDTYEVGNVKFDGVVQRVSDQAAVLRRWNGATLIVIAKHARGSSAAAVASVVSPAVQLEPAKLEPVIAKMPEQIRIKEPAWMEHTSLASKH